MLKNSLSPRLLKKVQMSLDIARDREPVERQGGVTHPSDGYPGPSEAYLWVRRSERTSAPTPQMGLFQQPAREDGMLPVPLHDHHGETAGR